MIGKGATQIRPVTLAEVAKILERRQGMVGEFGFEQQTTLDYAKKFAKLKLSDAQELFNELVSLGLKPETAVKIADILPLNKAQLNLILSKDRSDVPEKKLAEIEGLIAKYSKKAKKIESTSQQEAEEKAEGEASEKKE
ncbi:MAG: RNA polymerase Rpb4 family protein [Candidatus Anstonellaceae archaeon]